MINSWFQALVLGIVQGITEWLPISSQGINTLVSLQFFQKPFSESVSISLWLHSGTILAALIYFRKDIMVLFRHLPEYLEEIRTHQASEATNLTTFLIIATILSGALGAPLLLLSLGIDTIPAALTTAVIGGFLIITGFVQRFALKSAGSKTITTKKDAIILGVVQALSVLPGFSRSGLTISTLLFRGYDTTQALRISFLMSIPVTMGALVMLGIINQIDFNLPIIGSMVAAFASGLLAIDILLRTARRIPFWMFCIVIGVLSQLPFIIEALIS